MLGLERLLDEEVPHLADGAELNHHQVDALSGTLAALIAELEQQNGKANGAGSQRAARRPANGAAADGAGDQRRGRGARRRSTRTTTRSSPTRSPRTGTRPRRTRTSADEVPEDPGADRRFWFEHATGAGKTVAAVGFIEASRTGGILILTHRRNLVDQFIGEISDRGYGERLSPPLLDGADHPYGPVTVETYQWFVRNAGRISDAYSIVICDEAHTALGEKTSACIRAWVGPVFIGMTATGALIARHVADLFPTQTSRFDLAQAARRGVIAPLRCIRIPPGPGVRTIAKVPLRKGEVDQDFDQEELAKLLDQTPFNVAIADLYKSRFRKVAGVLYTAGVKHANNVAKAFQDVGINAKAVSGETPKRELAEILAGFERGEVDVLCNAMLLAEGWNSPARDDLHAPGPDRLAPRLSAAGRPRHPPQPRQGGGPGDRLRPPGDHPRRDDRHPAQPARPRRLPRRRDRGRSRAPRTRPPGSRREARRPCLRRSRRSGCEVLERELWRIAVENLDHSEQHVWAALAGARVNPSGWRRAKAMLQHDATKELRRRFLLTCVQRNRNAQLRIKALAEIAQLRDPEAFDDAIDTVGTWPRDDRRAGTRVLLEALAERRIGRRDQAQAWVWRLAGYTRDLHEEYAVQRWPETKRLLGLLVNSSGRAHGRNARRLVHAARNQDRRLAAALLAAAVAHTPEGEEVLRGARMRAARKPSGVARELLRNFPKSGSRRRRRKRKGGSQDGAKGERRQAQRQVPLGLEGRRARKGLEERRRGRASGSRASSSWTRAVGRRGAPRRRPASPARPGRRPPAGGRGRRCRPPSLHPLPRRRAGR